jgi:hypothetical protein
MSIWSDISNSMAVFSNTNAVTSALGSKYAGAADDAIKQSQQATNENDARIAATKAQQYSAISTQLLETAQQYEIGQLRSLNKMSEMALRLLG